MTAGKQPSVTATPSLAVFQGCLQKDPHSCREGTSLVQDQALAASKKGVENATRRK